MKSRTIFQNNYNRLNGGSLIVEIMISFSLFILFTITTFTLYGSISKMKQWSLNELNQMYVLSKNIINNIDLKTSYYGNYSKIFSNKLFNLSKSDFQKSWGRTYCDQKFVLNTNNYSLIQNSYDIGNSNYSTDIEVRNGIVYLSADSSVSSKNDFFIFDSNNVNSIKLISSINTGPGVSGLEIAGPYAFLAQSSTVNQLQIIDIHDRYNPKIISQLRLPLPTSSTTPPFAKSIYYSNGYIYLGTEKWNGSELSIISVQDPYNPMVIGSYETNTLINDILVIDNKAYLATSDEKQMRVLDISNPSIPVLIDSFSPSGWQTQEGKAIDHFEENILLGRTVGGFNVQNNHELFVFSTSTSVKSKDIAGGVYGLLPRENKIFLITHNNGKEFQIFDSASMNKIYETGLNSNPVKMVCDDKDIYFATGDNKGFSFIKNNE